MLSLVLALLLSDQPMEKRYRGSTVNYKCVVNRHDSSAKKRENLPKGPYAYVSVTPKDESDKTFILGLYDFDNSKWHEISYIDMDKEVPENLRNESKKCMDNALKTEPFQSKPIR